MRVNPWAKAPLGIVAVAAFSLLATLPVRGQDEQKPAAAAERPAEATFDVRALADAVRELQAEVKKLHSQLSELQAEREREREEASVLRRESSKAKTQHAPQSTEAVSTYSSYPTPGANPPEDRDSSLPVTTGQEPAPADRLGRIEEDQQLTDAKLREQYQTKVESGSKYRLRVSGIVLLNLVANRGKVENMDFPTLALEREPDDPAGTFGASIRQTQIGLQVFGPDVAGAHTSAGVQFDFAGGFPSTPYGNSTGIMRLRTGTIRLDWAKTSLVAGQDALFFAPLTPTSLATLGVPSLSYAGNLWSWTPQVRIEHRFDVREGSSITVQGGILDSVTGEIPATEYYRSPEAGEKSAQPAYATRVAWSQNIYGHRMTFGAGGYYARQNWSFGRHVDGWASTMDLLLPLGKFFDLSGQFYRGRAVGGLGGGIGRSVLLSGALDDPATTVRGLDSMGGWAQLKFKPKTKFEVNGAYGQDNPFAWQLYPFTSNPGYYDALYSRNRSWFVNGIYQPRSDVLFSVEYRRIRSFFIGDESFTANHVNLSLGYIF